MIAIIGAARILNGAAIIASLSASTGRVNISINNKSASHRRRVMRRNRKITKNKNSAPKIALLTLPRNPTAINCRVPSHDSIGSRRAGVALVERRMRCSILKIIVMADPPRTAISTSFPTKGSRRLPQTTRLHEMIVSGPCHPQ
jgi:hypothetical protein